MHREALRPRLRTIIGLVSAIALVLAVAIPASAAGPVNGTAIDVQQITQAKQTEAGKAVEDARSLAHSGPVVAVQEAIVVQKNIQVVAGPKQFRDNVEQNAANVAVVDQNVDATTGDTSATGGGVAISGSAVSGQVAVVHQVNVQVVAGWGAQDGVTQNALNFAVVGQDTQLQTGDATADGVGSTAKSGNASALSVAHVGQRNVQIYVGRPNDGGGPVEMNAANVAVAGQTVLASTGVASATEDAKATSGDAKNRVFAHIDQTNHQFAW